MPTNSIKTGLIALFAVLNFAFLSAQSDSTIAHSIYLEGVDYYEDGLYVKSMEPLLKALELSQAIYASDHRKIEDIYYYLGAAQQGLRNNDEAIRFFEKGLDLAISREGLESEAVANFYLDLGNTYDQKYHVKKAKEFYEKALSLFRVIHGEESSPFGNVLMNIGCGQIKMGNYLNAENYLSKAHSVFHKSSTPNSKDFYRIYINTCNLLTHQKNWDRALDYAEKALEIKLMHYDTIHPSVYKYFANIGDIYQSQSMFSKALPYHLKSVEIAELSRGKEHPETAGLMGTLATLYSDLGQHKKAIKLQKEALRIQEKGLPATHPYLVYSYFEIGKTYERMNKFNKSIEFYNDALSKFRSAPYVPNQLVAKTLNQIAVVNFKKRNYSQSLKNIQEAFISLDSTFEIKNAADLFSNPTLGNIQSESQLLEILSNKSKVLFGLYSSEKKLLPLEESLKTSELTIELIEKIRRSFQSEDARTFLNSQVDPIFEDAIEQAYELYRLTKSEIYLKKAFEFSQKSKASIFWQNLNTQLALESSGIPQDVINELSKTNSLITTQQEDLYYCKSDAEKKEGRSKLFDLKNSYEQQISNLENYNENFYNLKYASNTIEWNLLGKTLEDRNSLLIDYFLTNEYLYIFTFSNNKLKCVKQKSPTNLSTVITELRNQNIHNINFDKESVDNYIRKIYFLDSVLIGPIRSSLTSNKNLVIIPHAELQLVSFESLAPESNEFDFRKLDYLLKKHSIEYAWSANLWNRKSNSNSSYKNGFCGFAPDFNNSDDKQFASTETLIFRKNFSELKFSETEIKNANNFFDGKIFLGSDATESEFIRQAKDSRILHLATHADVNDKSPLESGLVFSTKNDSERDGFLNTSEIYNLKFSADLVVMSACNTGFGKIVKGEGMLSLGRAFLYAGCKSVVMSLWLANDESTSLIMNSFYQNLSEGVTKNEALRQAKIDYLKNADPLTAHPLFWANLITVGDMQPLQNKHQSWIWFFGIALVFIVGFILKKSFN